MGSTTAIADENGWIETWQGFDAWGQRRNGEDWAQDWKQWAVGLTAPPWAQRTLQTDPFVEDTTTLNRYTYVHNNPLSLTDPTGFFSFNKAFRLIASVAISVYTGGLATAALMASNFGAAFMVSVLGGALAGGVAAVGVLKGRCGAPSPARYSLFGRINAA